MRTRKMLFHVIPINSYIPQIAFYTVYITYSIQFASIATIPEILPYRKYSYCNFHVDLWLHFIIMIIDME